MRFLVTAGPTREAIDPVRFLSNRSSGKTGFAIAAAAVARGHDVTLVAGPTALTPPKRVRRVVVESALDMFDAALAAFEHVDAVIMSAAVADYRPAHPSSTKLKKTGSELHLELVPNPDILAELGRRKRHQVLIGFALETNDLVANARGKLRRKNLDLIVANGPGNLGADTSEVRFLSDDDAGATDEILSKRSKPELAYLLVERTEALVMRSRSRSGSGRSSNSTATHDDESGVPSTRRGDDREKS